MEENPHISCIHLTRHIRRSSLRAKNAESSGSLLPRKIGHLQRRGHLFLNSNGAGATGGWGSLNGSARTSDVNCWVTSTAPSACFCMVGSQGLYCGTSSSSRGSRTIYVWSVCQSVWQEALINPEQKTSEPLSFSPVDSPCCPQR